MGLVGRNAANFAVALLQETVDPTQPSSSLSQGKPSHRSSREPTWFASVHAQASPVPPEILELHPWDEAPLCNPGREVWQMDLIPFELQRLFAGQTFVWGGDLNSAVRMDTSPGLRGEPSPPRDLVRPARRPAGPLTTTWAVEADFEALRKPKG